MENNTEKFQKNFIHQLSVYQNLRDLISAGHFVHAIFGLLIFLKNNLPMFGSWMQMSNEYSIFEIPYKMNFSKGKCHCSSGVLETQVTSFHIRLWGKNV